MAFVKEYVPKEYIQLLNSFEMYDYDFQKTYTFGTKTIWVADKEREIYFTRVSWSASLDHDKQFDLIWQGKKVAIFMKTGISKLSLTDNSGHYKRLYKVEHILAPKEFEAQQDEMFEIIKEAITAEHYTDIIQDVAYKTNDEIILPEFPVPKYVEAVK
ncbi:MAG: hypothetical protein IJO29_08495 [Oscillospiraceae bacterium]|nr:hypothetical protein [Oscillospiraceae bacterium]